MKNIILFAATIFALCGSAQTDLEKALRIDSILSAYTNKNLFNGSVLIAKKDKILLSKGYGQANFAFGIPNSATTKFKLASVSKQFTAMSVLILQERGLLNTNDKLSKFIPDFPNGDRISLHHLLTHSSGIVDFTSLPVYDSIMNRQHTPEQLISYAKNKKLEFEPGTKFSYSNSGYIILSYVIEKASGMELGNFLSANIFEPLGMKNSGLWHSREIIKNAAVGYNLDEKPKEARYIDMSVPSGAGAIYSTVEDLYLWDRALYTEKLVKKSTLEKMMTPFKDNYAYGLQVGAYAGRKMISHSGGIEGFSTIMYHFPEDELFIVILRNTENQNMFASHKITRAIMYSQPYQLPAERKAIAVSKQILEKLAGEYELNPGFVLSITTEEGRIFAQATGQPKAEIFPESELRYFPKVVDALFEFTKDEKGNTTALVLSQGGAKLPAKKIK